MSAYSPLIIAGLTVLVYILRRLLPNLPKRYIPLVAVVLAASTAILGQGAVITPQVLIDGLLTGLGSIGLWELGKSAVRKS